MPNIKQDTFVCVDCETTGLDVKKDRIIEVAFVKFTLDTIIDEFETLIDPGCVIPPDSIKIHNITNEMVQGKPKIEDILPHILELISGYIIVGHGIRFDIDVINSAAKRANIPCKIKENVYIDTLRMARRYGESPINSLEKLRKHFNIDEEGAHRAMSDVVVNVQVFRQLMKDYKSTDELLRTLAQPILLKVMPLGKHKGRPFKEIPLEYLQWASKGNFDRDLLYSIRSEIKRRKKGSLFSQAGNPFSDLE